MPRDETKSDEISYLDGERVTLQNAERLIRRRLPHAYVKGATGFDRQRDYFVYPGTGQRAGAMYLAHGKTKPQAWKLAALELIRKDAMALTREIGQEERRRDQEIEAEIRRMIRMES